LPVGKSRLAKDNERLCRRIDSPASERLSADNVEFTGGIFWSIENYR
jgi:hypothetical protein